MLEVVVGMKSLTNFVHSRLQLFHFNGIEETVVYLRAKQSNNCKVSGVKRLITELYQLIMVELLSSNDYRKTPNLSRGLNKGYFLKMG